MNLDDDKPILIRTKLAQAISECERHIRWANIDLHSIKDLFPLSNENYQKLKDEEEALIFEFQTNNDYNKFESLKTSHFDQFLYRYTKLQDRIWESIIQPLSMLFEYWDRPLSSIDCLNILEKYDIIENTESFERLREIRNAITHEYSDSTDHQVATLNSVYSAYNMLLTVFEKIKQQV